MVFIPKAHDGMCHGLPFRPILSFCPNNIKSVGAIIEIGGGRNDPNMAGGRFAGASLWGRGARRLPRAAGSADLIWGEVSALISVDHRQVAFAIFLLYVG